ncbi:MAG: ABC transporter ATP-binding protein [Anaeroplasma sp.]
MLTGKHVNKYYKKYIIFFIIGIIALILVDYFQLEIPKICGKILDGVKDGTLMLEENSSVIVRYMMYLGLIAFIMFSGRFAWRYCILGVAARIESDIREDMFIHAEKLSNQYYKEHKTGALMALFTNDLQVIRQAFGSGTIALIDAIFLGSFALYKMIKCNWILAFFSVIPMILIVVVSVTLGRIMKQKFTKRQEAYDDLSDFAQENFSGISVIKAFVKEIHEVRHFDKLNQNYYDSNISYVKFVTLLEILLTAIISFIIAILFGGGAYFVIKEQSFFGETFTAGKLWEFIAYFDTLVWPFMAITQLIQMRAQAKASYNRISELLDTKVEIKDENVVLVDEIKGKIEFLDLSFNYPGGDDVLHNISFKIEAGQMIGIIGKTGCGKTTIVDLLLRTYNLPENKILIDDIDIMHLPYKKVRDAIGYVPQDNFLFSDTIANNIAFAFDDFSTNKIIEAAKLADVHNNIIEFNDKYDTILGERGVTLSGGQKQRVSIARALIKNPSILIFDDSVSAVDTKTEENILTNLRNIRKGKTTIMIAHRISTVQSLDNIIILDEGRVVGIGKHDDLLKSNKIYQEMVRLQSLEAEITGGED